MMDKIFAIGSFIGLAIFAYVVMKFVAEPDLWVVLIVVLFIAGKFIWDEIRAGGSQFEQTEGQADKNHDRVA